MQIHQSDLVRLKQLYQQRQKSQEQYEKLRAELLARFDGGATVEPGDLDLSVTEAELRQFSFEQMVRLVGFQEAERLRAGLIPKRQTTVKIIKSRRYS